MEIYIFFIKIKKKKKTIIWDEVTHKHPPTFILFLPDFTKPISHSISPSPFFWPMIQQQQTVDSWYAWKQVYVFGLYPSFSHSSRSAPVSDPHVSESLFPEDLLSFQLQLVPFLWVTLAMWFLMFVLPNDSWLFLMFMGLRKKY